MSETTFTPEQLAQVLEAQPELLEGLANQFYTPERVSKFLETDEGKRLLQPKLDKYFNKGLETWKHNNLQRIIDEEVLRRNPAETPEARQMREMQERLARIEKEKTRQEMKNLGIMLANERQLPTALVDYFVGDTDSATRENINFLELEFKSALERSVQERLKSTSHQPGVPSTSPGSESVSAKDFTKMSYAERKALYDKNPELFMKLARG